MEAFAFQHPTKLIFGLDEEQNIGAYLKPLASKLLLHYGGGSILRSGLYERVTASLSAAGVEFVPLGGALPNPRMSLVREGIALCRRENVQLVLAVGGGSAIDSAKAIAMGAVYDGDLWELFAEKRVYGKSLPVACILTLPAAGSETSKVTVITDEVSQIKTGHHDEAHRPVLSVINPALFTTLPKNQIANGAADMMSHIFERYFTPTLHTDVSDGMCEGVLRAVLKNAPKAYDNPGDVAAWSELGWAGSLAHNDLLGRGRLEDWACHGMEHELSALYDIAHGAGLAVLTPHWMEYVWRECPGMFLQFAHNVMGVAPGRDPEGEIAEAIRRLREFYRRLGLPASLRELGIGPERFEEMAKKVTGAAFGKEDGRGNIKRLLWEDVREIYIRAL